MRCVVIVMALGSISHPMQYRLSFRQARAVVPLPMNGSSMVSPGSESRCTSSVNLSSDCCQWWYSLVMPSDVRFAAWK